VGRGMLVSRWSPVKRHMRWLHTGYVKRIPSGKDRIFVAMSSGVDSSTTAALLAQEYPGQVAGVYMRNWSATAKCTEAEWNDVQKVCDTLKIPCQQVNFEPDYWTEVFEPMIQLYRSGLTPNPDVGCNRHIKFGSLVRHLESQTTGNWWLATGHYAKVAQTSHGTMHLLRPKDLSKDQSYYLSTIMPNTLSRILFPLAQYKKPEVRELARKFHLPTASKPDSQGLCFVSQEHNNFRNFLAEYVEPAPGDVVTENGRVVGKHDGIWHATIGQRSGVSMPQGDAECKGVWYISDKNIEKNQLVIVRGANHPSLFFSGASSSKFRWLGPDIDLSDIGSLRAQYRSLQDYGNPIRSLDCSNHPGVDSVSTVKIEFENPVRAVAPGQYLVVYQGDRVVGSGMIDDTWRQSPTCT
jgi:tRNA (5-methylaminomethyl-2-thiouridylate)-methyltransferase